MNITLALTVLGQKLGTIDIRLDLDQPAVGGTSPMIDRGIKKLTRWYTGHMSS